MSDEIYRIAREAFVCNDEVVFEYLEKAAFCGHKLQTLVTCWTCTKFSAATFDTQEEAQNALEVIDETLDPDCCCFIVKDGDDLPDVVKEETVNPPKPEQKPSKKMSKRNKYRKPKK